MDTSRTYRLRTALPVADEHGHFAVELRVAGAIHHAHAPASQLCDGLVPVRNFLPITETGPPGLEPPACLDPKCPAFWQMECRRPAS